MPGPAEPAAEPAEVQDGLDLGTCDHVGFATTSSSLSQDETTGQFLWAAIEGGSGAFSWLKVTLPAAPALGEVDLAGQPAGTCETCITVDAECVTGGGQVNCARTFVPESGTLRIDSAPIVLASMTSNGTGLPTASAPALDGCVEEGNGSLIGSNIANFSLTNCLGDTVELHDSCDD